MQLSKAVLFILPFPILAQDTPADPALKAREYLEMAGGMVGALAPESQPVALLQLALVEAPVDKAKAREHFEQAFAGAAAMPSRTTGRLREQIQARSVMGVTPLDVNRAIEMASAIAPARAGEQDVRADAIFNLIQHLVREKKFDKAVEAMDRFNAGGAYPLRAAGFLLKQLPPGDPRRGAMFSAAVAGFGQNPDCHNMIQLLRDLTEMPEALRQTAVAALMRAIQEDKGMPFYTAQTLTSNSGSVSLDSAAEIMAFNAADLIRSVDSGWLAKFSAERPKLKAGLERFPGGITELRAGGNLVVSLATGNAPGLGADSLTFQRALEYASKDPSKALTMSAEIPDPRMQTYLVREVARASKSKPPAEASTTLTACIERLDGIKQVGARHEGWDTLAEAAGAVKDFGLAMKAVERGMSDAAAILKVEAGAEGGNIAPRSSWVSSQVYKRLFYRAAKSMGPAAENLLERLQDAELQTMARIEMAAAWLGQDPTPNLIHVARRERR